MGDRLQTDKPSRYVTSHPDQLSLAILPWVGATSTSESWGVNRHTARYTSPVTVVSQCKLCPAEGKETEISVAMGLVAREGLYFFTTYLYRILLLMVQASSRGLLSFPSFDLGLTVTNSSSRGRLL